MSHALYWYGPRLVRMTVSINRSLELKMDSLSCTGKDSINGQKSEEYTEACEGFNNRSYNLLKVEYERCRQENYDLKRKLQINETMLYEIQEANNLLECSVNQHITEKKKIEEKYQISIREQGNLKNIISDLEMKVEHQEKQIAQLLKQADNYEKTKCTAIINPLANLSLEEDNLSLKNNIDELSSILEEERNKVEHANHMIEELTTRCNELEYYSQSIKQQLDEKSQALEQIRMELNTMKNTEMTSLEMNSIPELHKGNSLFAEVEDHRQHLVNKVDTLGKKYTEIKRICRSQIAEIKQLRTERVTLFKKCKNDIGDILTENEELIKQYKSRVSDLENKLKIEINKNDDPKQLNLTDSPFKYLESVLNAKKKEVNELRMKVEDLTTKLLIKRDIRMYDTKELHYWQHKASILEAQIYAGEAESKLKLLDVAEHEVP